MKRPARIDSSFRLLLKQGFRGLFKFKVQFSIILILSFLATLILTVSVGVISHLSSNYNQIVNRVPRFAYSATTQIDRTATTNEGGASINEYQPVPLVDFANNANVNSFIMNSSIQDITPDEDSISELLSSYNFILNDDLYRDQFANPNDASTFITKFMKDAGNNGFRTLTEKALSRTNNVLDDLYKQEVARSLGWRLLNDIQRYVNIVKEGNPNDPISLGEVSYLRTTSIAFLTLNRPQFLDFIPEWISHNSSNPNHIDPILVDNLPYAQLQFIDYVYWMGVLFGNWLVSEFNRYVKANGNNVPNASTFYRHLMGDDGDRGYFLNVVKNEVHESANDDRYLLIAQSGSSTSQANINRALFTNGFKGMTSPMVIQLDSENKINNVIFTNFYQGLSLQDPNWAFPAFNKNLSWEQNFNSIWNPGNDNAVNWQALDANPRATIYQYHLQLTAMASGYEINFRKESLIFDMISSFKFRFIVQNGFDEANFSILQGSLPSAVGEVAISEQFARANHIHLGDYLAIGQTEVMVVAFGTDAYSFMPIVDSTVPIPEPKTGAFVYGSAQTFQQIRNGFGGSSESQDLTPNYYNYFLTDRPRTFTPTADKLRLFTNLQMDLTNNLGYNLANLRNLQPTALDAFVGEDGSGITIPPTEIAGFWNLKDFDSSPYNSNWKIMPLVLRVLRIVAYIASLVIALIALIALIICINKTIMANAKQMGILKAMGLNPWKIAFTYLAYGIVIMFIIVPVAWAIGLLLEIPFIYLFGTYFSVDLLSINSAWPAFVIAFLGFGILALIVSLLAAYRILKRPVLDIFDLSVQWSKSKFFDFLKQKSFNRGSFNFRFSLTLASAGIQPILLLTIVIFLTSLLISGSLAIPAIANKAIISYYQNIRYANSYTNLAPTINSPLSKAAINYWRGNAVWDRDWVSASLELDRSGTKYGYYKDPMGYTDSVSQASVIPRYLYNPQVTPEKSVTQANKGINYSYVFILSHPTEFLRYVSTIFGDNFFTVLGESFSIGTVDQFLGLILNGDEAAIQSFMGDDYDYNQSLDWNKQQLSFSFMGILSEGLPNIISQVIQAINNSVIVGGNGDVNATWKDQIVEAILTQVPPYIRSYIYKSPSRTEQFGISFNSQTYTPTKESIFTEVAVDATNYNGIKLLGLDRGQSAFVIPRSDQDNVFLSAEIIKQIETILRGGNSVDLAVNNRQIWNAQTKTLTIPVLANRQARSSYHLDKNPVLSGITSFGRQIKYHTTDGVNPWQVVPNKAWIYDDSEFVNSDVFNDATLLGGNATDTSAYQTAYRHSQGYYLDTGLESNKSYLDPYALDNNKFTYADIFDGTTLTPGAYMFNDFAVNEISGQLESSYVRPYYMYKNLQLYLPLEKINQTDILGSMAVENQGEGIKNDAAHPWFEVVDARNVPQPVKEAWGSEAGSRYLMIRPYDLRYVADPPRGLERITSGQNAKYWLRYAYDKVLGPGALAYENNAPIHYGQYAPSGTHDSGITVNLESVGTLESYNSKLMIIDANVANLLNQFSLARAFGYQNSFFSGEGKIDKDETKPRPWPDHLVVYPLRNAAEDVLVSKDQLSRVTYLRSYAQANSLAPLRWNSGKFSNIVEPESLTSSVSFNVIDNLGQYSLGLGFTNGLGMTTLIKDQTLLSTQRALINQIFTLSISLAVLLIIAIVVTGSLLIMLMGDIYIAQYQSFMILMRALGYANWEIQTYAFSMVSVFSFVAWIVATVVAWAIVFGVIRQMSNRGVAIPYGLSWWPIIVSLIIIVLSFLGSLWVSSYKVRHDPVSLLMSEN